MSLRVKFPLGILYREVFEKSKNPDVIHQDFLSPPVMTNKVKQSAQC
ncbi:hypothetical protein FBALC1_05668 [Flavobacteriales bacterium ALC-1]|nr:hypothetical protein FBALC1_05668 [Flavobacteriales bacterium ALC-1]